MDNPFRAVLVGCGGISHAWLKPAVQLPNLQIVGLVDLLADTAQKRAAEYKLKDVETGSNLSKVLDLTAPDIVFDCTVPEAHIDVTLEALSRGCHVLGEKPMADSMQHARRMVAAAQASGKLYAVMQNRRYMAEIRALRSYLERGTLGALTTCNCDFYLAPHFGGFREQMQHVLLLDMAIHTFDAARFLTGADPVSVYCKEWNPAGSWYAHGASAVAVFEMSSGIIFTYRGSWCAEGLSTTWESDWRLIGERGTAAWDGAQNLKAEVALPSAGFLSEHRSDVIKVDPSDPKTGGHAGLIADFVDCVRTGRTPETVCTDNIKSLAMVFGAIESADEGMPINIPYKKTEVN
jgi:predicted dehydrogenase